MHVGWHFLEEGYNGVTLPAACFLDVGGSRAGMRSPARLCRLYFKGRPDPAHLAPLALQWHAQGCRVQLANEPNHPIEEFGGGPAEYRAWFAAVKALAPAARLYWAGPSPGFPDWEDWLLGAEIADGIALHAYGTLSQMRAIVDLAVSLHPELPLWIAECNFGAGQQVDRDAWARAHFKPFLDYCATVPQVEAVTYFAHAWPTPDMATPTPVDGRGTEIERVLVAWQPPAVVEEEPEMSATERLIDELRKRFGSEFEDLRARLTKHKTDTYRRRAPSQIEGYALHHTGSGTTRATTWQQVADFHVNTNNWPGIAYHVGIRLYNGRVTVSLLNDLETVSYHVGDANTTQAAICVAGNFTGYEPDPAELAVARSVVASLDAALGRKPSIRPHHFFRQTECPALWTGYIPTLRQAAPPQPEPDPFAGYVIGEGIRRAMKEHDDTPVTSEMYGYPHGSRAYGRRNVYDWIGSEVVVVERLR